MRGGMRKVCVCGIEKWKWKVGRDSTRKDLSIRKDCALVSGVWRRSEDGSSSSGASEARGGHGGALGSDGPARPGATYRARLALSHASWLQCTGMLTLKNQAA